MSTEANFQGDRGVLKNYQGSNPVQEPNLAFRWVCPPSEQTFWFCTGTTQRETVQADATAPIIPVLQMRTSCDIQVEYLDVVQMGTAIYA